MAAGTATILLNNCLDFLNFQTMYIFVYCILYNVLKGSHYISEQQQKKVWKALLYTVALNTAMFSFITRDATFVDVFL